LLDNIKYFFTKNRHYLLRILSQGDRHNNSRQLKLGIHRKKQTGSGMQCIRSTTPENLTCTSGPMTLK